MSHKSKGQPLTMAQLEHAIKRNFGGLESTDLNPLKEFQSEIGFLSNNQELSDNEVYVHPCTCLFLTTRIIFLYT